jgi:hypothetical protein
MVFAAELQIKPWEIGSLTVMQFRQAIAEFKRLQEEREKQR